MAFKGKLQAVFVQEVIQGGRFCGHSGAVTHLFEVAVGLGLASAGADQQFRSAEKGLRIAVDA